MTLRHAMAAWRDDAECAKNYPPEWWFPAGDTSVYNPGVARAKAVCARCPVVQACGEEALREGYTDGIWGGKTDGELQAIRREITVRKAERAQETT